jgi:hypothetical protein
VAETGGAVETIEHQPRQFAEYSATVDVPILRSPQPGLRYMRDQHLSQSQVELQAQSAVALDTQSCHSMSGLSGACGSSMAGPYHTQHLDRQRAVSMQPLDHDAMRTMPQSAPLPGLNHLMDRMADNQNNWSAGFSQVSFVQGQRSLSQQPITQSFSVMSADNPAHDSTLVYDQSGQLFMRPRAASQQLLADDSVGGDVHSTGIKISFSPFQLRVSSAIAHESPSIYARDQMYLDQRAMDQQVAQSASGHLAAVDSQDNQLSPSQLLYHNVPSAPFSSSPGHHAYQQSTLRGPPPGLPATGSFIWPESQCEYAEQFMSIQDVLRNTVMTGVQQPVVEQTAPNSTAFCHSHLNPLASPVSYPISSGSQRPQFVAQKSALVSGTTHRAQKPVFGFATTSEAESFQPSPRKPACDMQATYSLPSVEQIQTPGQESPQPTRQKIVLGFPPAAPSGHVKPERLSPAPFGICQADDADGDPGPTNLSVQVWNNFAPHSASFSDVRHEQASFGSSKGSNDGGFPQGNPSSRLEPGEAVDPNRYSKLDGSLGDSHSPGSSAEHVSLP